MKRILFLAVMAAAIAIGAVSCNLDGYTVATVTSVSTFEYESGNYVDSLYLSAPFYSEDSYGTLVFNSYREYSGADMTGGFGLTMKRDSSLVISEDNNYPQYTIFGNGGARGSKSCAVFYQNPDESAMPDHDIYFYYRAGEDCTCTPTSCTINNTQLTVYSVLSDDSEYKFEPGDYLKLTFTGYSENSKTGSVDYYLADYRGAGEKIDSVLTTWKTLSLSALGDIDYIDIDLECSKEDFPTYFCMDNFIAGAYISF
ncbi:MAG: DUF4465 domain-containing protein [Bacteroidales bacterium]|nr:DUF4465 domain-containing protein [Bacteroidales bacterium]MCD8313902.1 DUF4465 domain-containing protein [Bacteroidales bacterium]